MQFYMKFFSVLSLMSLFCLGLLAQNKVKHEYVDLGLSVKWATCNVGANAPEEFGGYYAWAETEVKQEYTWRNYKYCNGSSSSLTKYCVGDSYGTSDNCVSLQSSDDVASVAWGGKWRIPTDAELTELHEKCTWTWTTLNGVNGYEVKGKNGKTIFLPAAGSRQAEESMFVGAQGIYCSSTSCREYSFSAYNLTFDNQSVSRVDISRRFGVSVRPVCK